MAEVGNSTKVQKKFLELIHIAIVFFSEESDTLG